MMAGSEVYFSGGPWLEAFIGSAPGRQQSQNRTYNGWEDRLTLVQQSSNDIDMTMPNCLDERSDPGVIWKIYELCVKQGRKSQTLELDVESGGVRKEFNCPLEITVSASLPESRHHFERNAKSQGKREKNKFK
jgi:hypothetical protein